MWVPSLCQENSLKKGMDNPLQYSCLENPVASAAWWSRKQSDTTEAHAYNISLSGVHSMPLIVHCALPVVSVELSPVLSLI